MKTLFFEDSNQRKFILRFGIVACVLFLFMYLNQQNLISRPVNQFTAHSVSGLAKVIGFSSNVKQITYVRERGFDRIHVPTTLLTVGNYTARVILECSAVHAIILLVAFLLAYPSTALQKVHGMIFLIPVIVVFNTFRIFVLMVFAHYFGHDSPVQHIFHIYIMRFLMIALVLVLALIWLSGLDVKKHDNPIRFFLRFVLISGVFIAVWVFLKESFGLKESSRFVGNIWPLMVFVSLVLASSRLDVFKDYKDVLVGLGIMVIFLICLQLAHFSFRHFHSAYAELLFVLVNSAFNYILPFGLFWFLTRKKLFVKTNLAGKEVFICPICGKDDVRNLKAHAEAKHIHELRKKDERLMSVIKD